MTCLDQQLEVGRANKMNLKPIGFRLLQKSTPETPRLCRKPRRRQKKKHTNHNHVIATGTHAENQAPLQSSLATSDSTRHHRESQSTTPFHTNDEGTNSKPSHECFSASDTKPTNTDGTNHGNDDEITPR